MAVHEYDPGKVDISFAGLPITGFASGTFITAEREADAYTKSIGADGEATRTRNRNISGMVTLTLTQTALSNQDLSLLAVVDEETGTGVAPLMVKDNAGNSIYLAAEAWIRKVPNGEFGDEAGNREWVFDCATIDMFSAGN